MLENMIKTNKVIIVSGEDEVGVHETYDGKRTIRAIKMRLTKERCGGDRKAKALVYSHSNAYGDVFTDIESPEEQHLM